MYGIGDSRFVITVAPQNDICRHGSTYPMNAVAIVRNTPTDHVCMKLYDPQYRFRPACTYMHTKNNEASFACRVRNSHPVVYVLANVSNSIKCDVYVL